MYSEIFGLTIKNPDGEVTKRYIIDYNGNETVKELKKKIVGFIKKNHIFDSREFTKECLNDMSCCHYVPNLEVIDVDVPKKVWDIDLMESIPF